MRLAHLSDIHLGFRQYYRQTPSGVNQREADVAQAFRAAIRQVIAAQPDAVVIAGDLFHAVRPSNQAIVFCFRELQALRAGLPDAEILIIAGNHDTPRATETGSILRLFSELDITIVSETAERLASPRHPQLSITAVPHQAIVASERIDLAARGTARYQVLVIHGEVEGLEPLDRWWAEPGGAELDRAELIRGGWTYVALGHYHVMRRIAERVWYSGALDYVTPNPWGELAEQRRSRVPGKGWLLVDLDTGEVTPKYIESPRQLIDLERIQAADLAPAQIDALIKERIGKVPGGIKDRLVRLVVQDVTREVARELDHAAIRSVKGSALHFHLDLRRPESIRRIGVGAPGPRQTLTDVLRAYLAARPLPPGLDRDRFVTRGVELLESVTLESERPA